MSWSRRQEFTPPKEPNFLKERLQGEPLPRGDMPLRDAPLHVDDEPADMPAAPAATTLTRKPLDEIATLVRSLTYGEMIELSEGIWKTKPEDGAITAENLPTILHKWSQARGSQG